MTVPSESFWRLSATAFFAAAIYHLSQIPTPDQAVGAPWFHTVFVGIDLFFAAGLLLRPPWLPMIFACLVVHQIWTHGARAIALWSAGAFDHLSFLVIVMMPVWLVALCAEQRYLNRVRAPNNQSEALKLMESEAPSRDKD